MRIVVTDACIFIDLMELQLAAEFFGLTLEIHTTVDVINELYSQQQDILRAYEQSGKLVIHILSPSENIALAAEDFPKALSAADRSVIYVARKLNATVLSSDKPVRNHAKRLAIEYHGMIWIFDQLVEQGLLPKMVAVDKMKKLIVSNLIYKGNETMMKEMENRIKAWAS